MTIISTIPGITQFPAPSPTPAANTCAAPAAHPGHPRWKKPATRKNQGQKLLSLSSPRKILSPVAMVQRCSSVLMKNCVRTPTQNAQYSPHPFWAMSNGQNSVSPLPSDAPSMIALGPTMWFTFGTRGNSAMWKLPPFPVFGYASVSGAVSISSISTGLYAVPRYSRPSSSGANTSPSCTVPLSVCGLSGGMAFSCHRLTYHIFPHKS
jgi:hypothetical protein